LYPSQLYCADPDTYPVVIRTQLVTLYSFLRARGVEEVRIVDLELELGRPTTHVEVSAFCESARRLVDDTEWDVIGISCYTSVSYTATIEIARLLKAIQPHATIVVGGYHCLAASEDFESEAAVDFVVRGDGVLFFDAFLRGDSLPRIVSLPGTGAEPPRMLYSEYPYRYRELPAVSHIQLSRGCPFTCAFCCEPFMGNSRFVPLPVDEALAVVDNVICTQRPDKIIVEDLLFGLNAKWRHEFLEALRGQRYKQLIWIEMRADTITERTVKLFSEMNIELTIGLESASAETLRVMDKAKDPQRYIRAFHETAALVQRYGVPTTFTIMLNFPGETLDTFNETMANIHASEQLGPSRHFRFAFNEYAFYPGNRTYTELDDLHARYGTKIGDPRWYARRDGDMLGKSLCEVPSQRLLRQVAPATARSYFKPLVDDVIARQLRAGHLRGRLFWSYRFVRSLQRRFWLDEDYFARDLPSDLVPRAKGMVMLADRHRLLAAAMAEPLESAGVSTWPLRMRAWRAAFNHIASTTESAASLDDPRRMARIAREIDEAIAGARRGALDANDAVAVGPAAFAGYI
jgi:radical SAM superfamily enzyme YgiQ (UPF0313 family)